VEYGYIKDGKVYRKSFLDFPEREIGTVKESEEATIQYFTQKFEAIVSEVEDVKSKVEEHANKGSFLIKVINLKESLGNVDALGDFEGLYHALEQLETELNEYIAQNRHKNLQIKTALLEELRVVAASHEWKSATEAIKDVQQRWMKTGAVEVEHRERIEGEFKQLVGDFFDRRAAFYADLEKMMIEKEADYEAFLNQAAKQLAETPAHKLRAVHGDLKKRWKELGKIKPDSHSAFWEKFQKLLKDSLRKAKQQSGQSPEESRKLKEALVERLRQHSEELVPKVELRKIQGEWKSIGFPGKEANKKLQTEYRKLTMLIGEKQFLDRLLNKKARKGMNEGERETLRIKLLQDLLYRDTTELKTFEENVVKFNTASGLDSLLDRKLADQKEKVAIKRALLSQLKDAKKAS
tara:strand:+ start:4609 stop:5832 length:1224 start_codon:yes stop_codon:yes gene_type:complete